MIGASSCQVKALAPAPANAMKEVVDLVCAVIKSRDFEVQRALTRSGEHKVVRKKRHLGWSEA